MTLTFEVTPEEAQRIDRAKLLGFDIQALLPGLIASLPGDSATAHFFHSAQAAEWEAAMDELAEGGENLPDLPNAAFDREYLYEDRL